MTAGISDLSAAELGKVALEARELHMRYHSHRRTPGAVFVTFTWSGLLLERRLDLPNLDWDPEYRKFTPVTET
jgi:hypothetical protein